MVFTPLLQSPRLLPASAILENQKQRGNHHQDLQPRLEPVDRHPIEHEPAKQPATLAKTARATTGRKSAAPKPDTADDSALKNPTTTNSSKAASRMHRVSIPKGDLARQPAAKKSILAKIRDF
jgi:hypothetical protein